MFLPAKFLWSSKVPSKVKALAWLVAHGKVNTNDKLQLRRPYKALCPQWCILCKGNGESIDHLFLHCPVTIGLLAQVVQSSRNNRIFEDKGRTEEMVWDLIRFYSSLWASCTEAFRGVPLSILQLNWIGISQQEPDILELPFMEEEVHSALMDMNGDKAPGPDGFTGAFWQFCWEFVKEEVLEMFKEFHEHNAFLKSLNTTFLVLIPKKGGAEELGTSGRSVSWAGCIKFWLRQILDASLIANEVIDSWKKEGEKAGFFSSSIGLRQGDPLSPYLFIMGMEVLSALIWRAVEGGCISECRIQRAGSYVGLKSLQGLRINLAKSEIIPVGEVDEILEMAVELGCKVGQLPSTYLRLPLGAPNKAVCVWDGVEERMRWKLALWKRQYISKGGRITLIKSTLASMPLYQLSLFRMPRVVARRLEKLQRDFLWEGGSTERKAHLVNWERVCVGKEKGGLGLRKLVHLNKALLGVEICSCQGGDVEMCSLWQNMGKRNLGGRTKKANGAFGVGVWKEILKETDWCWDNMTFKVGKGTKSGFGRTLGCGDVELARRFPHSSMWLPKGVPLWGIYGTRILAKEGIWVENVPSKLAFFAWEATWGVLTLDRLQKRGWQFPNRCYLCGSDEENVNHLLIHCTVASVLWGIVLSLFGAQWVFPETVKEAVISWKGSFGAILVASLRNIDTNLGHGGEVLPSLDLKVPSPPRDEVGEPYWQTPQLSLSFLGSHFILTSLQASECIAASHNSLTFWGFNIIPSALPEVSHSSLLPVNEILENPSKPVNPRQRLHFETMMKFCLVFNLSEFIGNIFFSAFVFTRRFNATDFLVRLRGKRLMLVGDSMNRNQFESLLCLLHEGLPDKSRMYEIHGHKITKEEATLSSNFADYNCTVEFVRSHFLVREGTRINGQGNSNPTLSIDRIDKFSWPMEAGGHSCLQYWTLVETGCIFCHSIQKSKKNYYKEGDVVYPKFDAVEAYRRSLRTWGRWIDKNVNPAKQLVFYRGYSSAHFRGGDWDSGGACNGETEPILSGAFLNNYPLKMKIVEEVIQEMQVPVILLNVTRLTNFRKDGHPSVYGKNITEGKRVSTRKQDCSHWCLPGSLMHGMS
ncbi:Protein trichome birefringence-like 5 [Vitis vinifera]|uniref:Protein trichome birefringence-like 5 n=1 Tax=Vitis vinifera TaxID=29760 RepID=A0A438H864_VITVI|nr:Protein trichome birefringence-like 5 [Vitis vinifera]